MRISDWSSDVCSSDLQAAHAAEIGHLGVRQRDAAAESGRTQTFAFEQRLADFTRVEAERTAGEIADEGKQRLFRIELNMRAHGRSEEHTSELQSLMRNSYAVFCLKKKKTNKKE